MASCSVHKVQLEVGQKGSIIVRAISEGVATVLKGAILIGSAFGGSLLIDKFIGQDLFTSAKTMCSLFNFFGYLAASDSRSSSWF